MSLLFLMGLISAESATGFSGWAVRRFVAPRARECTERIRSLVASSWRYLLIDPRKAKKILTEFRSRLVGREEEIGGSLAVSLEEEAFEESSDQHPADVGSVTFSRELDLTLQGNVERLLAQVDRALEKIEEGTYGRCDRCGRRIESGRLDAVPYATLCMEHQRELERSGGF